MSCKCDAKCRFPLRVIADGHSCYNSPVEKTNISNKKIAVGVSGGVDSAVSAYLLKEQGYDITGVYMQCWEARADGCKADEERKDAVEVCAHLGIKFVYLDFIEQYKTKVIEYFYKEYASGRTPNPDIMCNKEIKFGLFLDWAMNNGFNAIATGHYARVTEKDGKFHLFKGIDSSKDQSYFLYPLNQAQLSKAIFPVGAMYKEEVRELGKEAGLHNFDKPDSVGICFIGEVDIKEFLKKKLEVKEGDVLDVEGNVIGKHEGVWFYTIGQRHGFKLDIYTGLPMYVVGKNVERNQLFVGPTKEVLRNEFLVEDLHWIANVPELPLTCGVRIRHLGEIYAAVLDETNKVALADPVFGVAPGQSAVFYLGDECLGGGIIAG